MALGEYRPANIDPATLTNAQKHVREVLAQHDLTSEEGRIAINNFAYFAGVNHEHDVLWAAEGTPHYEIVEPAFKAGKAQFPR